jgi:hypothetical protein
MQTVVIDLKRAMVAVVLVLSCSLCAGNPVAAASAATPGGTRCTRDELLWLQGDRLADATSTIDTAMTVSVAPGERVRVVAVAADGVRPDGSAVAVPVHVGGVLAIVGGDVPAGRVVVGPSIDVPPGGLAVASTSLAVERCVDVAVLAPTTTVVSMPPGSGELPATGMSVIARVAVVAAIAAVAVGVAALVTSRRSSPAAVHGPGSQRVARRRVRG